MCQVGDLAGKYGAISTASFSAKYHDPYTSTSPGNAAFFGDKSITIHLPSKARIACANFKLVGVMPSGAPYPMSGASSGFPVPTGTGVPYPTATGAGSPSAPAAGSSGVPAGPSASTAVPAASGTGAPAASGSGIATGAVRKVKVCVAVAVFAAGFIAMAL